MRVRLTVVDAWQGRGVGGVILTALIRAARSLGYTRAEGYALPSNTGMLSLARRSRMHVQSLPDDPQVLRLTRQLLPRAARPAGRTVPGR